MKRKDAITAIRIAGYHNDAASYARVYCESRVSRSVADEAWKNGVKQKESGMKCGCAFCNGRF